MAEQNDLEQEQYKKMHFRMYENKYPKKNDIVYVSTFHYFNFNLSIQCKIKELTDSGAYVSLLEYDGIRGLLFSGEITLKRINHINRVLSVGKDEVLRVFNIDEKKGFIDLSKKQVKPDEVDQCKIKFAKSKIVEQIVKLLARTKDNKGMEMIYKKLIWPLYKTHKHALDALKEVLAGDDSILEGLKITDDIKEDLKKILKEKLVAQPVKIRSDFKLTCYTFEGIEAIKEALSNGEKKGTPEIPIKFRIIGSPLYECSINTINKKEGFEIMTQALDEVRKTIIAKNGNFLLETNPQVIGEDEKTMSEQLNEAKNKENEEEEQEEDEDENQEGIKENLPQFDAEEFQLKKKKK